MHNVTNTIEKEDRFRRVASRRTESVLRALRSLSKCANTRNYAYTDKQFKKIFSAIESELAVCKKAFETLDGKKKFNL